MVVKGMAEVFRAGGPHVARDSMCVYGAVHSAVQRLGTYYMYIRLRLRLRATASVPRERPRTGKVSLSEHCMPCIRLCGRGRQLPLLRCHLSQRWIIHARPAMYIRPGRAAAFKEQQNIVIKVYGDPGIHKKNLVQKGDRSIEQDYPRQHYSSSRHAKQGTI